MSGVVILSSLAKGLIAEFFDREFYLTSYPDIARAGVDPLEHYLSWGGREGRSPAPWFDPAGYREEMALGANQDAFLHLVSTDVNRARHLQKEQSKPSAVVARKTRPLMQPFYALQSQKVADGPVVFTAVAGDRHAMPNNTTVWPDMRVYGDTPMSLSGWKFIPSLYWDASPKMMALFHKYCLASLVPDGTKLIWVDSRVSVQQTIIHEISAVLDEADVCVFKHYERDCVYTELVEIVRAGRASYAEAEHFEARLRSEDFPMSDGLFETGVMGMRSTARTASTLRRVFGLARRYIPRDQVTLPLALKGSGLKVHVFNNGVTNLRNTPGVFVHKW